AQLVGSVPGRARLGFLLEQPHLNAARGQRERGLAACQACADDADDRRRHGETEAAGRGPRFGASPLPSAVSLEASPFSAPLLVPLASASSMLSSSGCEWPHSLPRPQTNLGFLVPPAMVMNGHLQTGQAMA